MKEAQKISRKFLIGILTFCLVTSSSCGENAFKELSNKTTDDALLYAAKILVNQGEYTEAISKISSMTDNGRVSKDAQKVLASAYAGRCGFTFITFIDGLSTATGTLFGIFMTIYQNIAVQPSDCYSAQLALETGYGASSTSRPTDINFLMALMGMSKIGTYLRSKADTDQDGAVDGTFDSCEDADPTMLTDAEMKQIISGFGLIIDNFAAVSSALTGGSAADLEDLQTACAAIPGDPLSGCTLTDPNDPAIDAAAIMAMRRILKEQTYGIENCADVTFISCC